MGQPEHNEMDFFGRICYGDRLEYFCRGEKIGIRSERVEWKNKGKRLEYNFCIVFGKI